MFINVQSMDAFLIPIGNSKGIRIPKPLLKTVGITERVTLELHKKGILISPYKENTRATWESKFHQNSKTKENAETFDDVLDVDLKEWKW